MTEEPFTNREVTKMFHDQSVDLKNYISEAIEPLTAQVTKTNGSVKRLYTYLTIVGTATVTLLIVNGSEFTSFILKLI